MSGFAVVWNTDGAPVDEALLIQMQNFLSSRGPDEQRLAIIGATKNIGLVNAAFQTTPDAAREHQPCTTDGVAWLNGHIRIDAREQLAKDVWAHNLSKEAPTDAQLILQAYQTWGHNFVDRIIGAYSFVIWDEREQRLFAVRDHLGTRPLFYARSERSWILSNTLECVRLHPQVSGEIDDTWMLNYVAHLPADFERTAYREIKRLPPGHVLDLVPTGGGVRKYWRLEIGEPIYYKRGEEYLEHFRDLARTAIKDRLRMRRVGVGMSGGLDSTSIVAFLLQLVTDKANDIVVNSTYSERLIFDDEPRYAAAAAEHFGISINFESMDDSVYDPEWWTRSWVPPEPSVNVLSRSAKPAQPHPFDQIRVYFVGDGPDEALVYEWKAYLRWLLRTGRFLEFSSAMHSRLSARPLGQRLSSLRAAFQSREMLTEKGPAWLRANVLDSQTSLDELQSNQVSANHHPWHPAAVGHLRSSALQNYFDSFDPGFGGRLLEAVCPFLDIRMVQFLMSVPVIPWCHDKFLIRESMRGLLPELVRVRKKTTLSDDPWVKAMVQHPFPPISKTQELARYVDISKIPNCWGVDVMENRYTKKFLALQYWLAARDRRNA